MRLRSDHIGPRTLNDAVVKTRTEHRKDIFLHEISVTRGRGKHYSITFYAYSLNGNRATNRGDGERAASWTAWGYLIAELFKIDPEAEIGQYKGVEDFVSTCQKMHDARERYSEQTGRKDSTYSDISFLKIVKEVPTA